MKREIPLSIFFLFLPCRLPPPTERGRSQGVRSRTEIGRQEKGTRALFEAFFYIDSGSISPPSDSCSSRHRGLVYKIFALVMRPWLSNGGCAVAPLSKGLKRQIEECRVWVPVTPSNTPRISPTDLPDSLCQETPSPLFSQTRRIHLRHWPLSNEYYYNTSLFIREIPRSNLIERKLNRPDLLKRKK